MNSQSLLAFVVWLVAATVAAKFDPAAFQLFVALTIFVIIARNLGERRHGPSAYSVFNPGCQSLLGQINAEQFDAEIRHRPTDTVTDPTDIVLHTTGGGLRNNHDDALEIVRREIWLEAQRAKANRSLGRSRRGRS